MELKGTQTEKNLLISFAGESQARNRYTYWAKIAKKEGYVQAMNVFLETADQEKEHAKRFFKFLKEGNANPTLTIEYEFPTGPMGTTVENLRAAAEGEHHEFTNMYPGFADVAEKEELNNIAVTWRRIADAEKWHYDRFKILANKIDDGSIFKRDRSVRWRCQNCGYIHEGEHPPEKCPACDHPKGHFMIHTAEF